VTLLRKLASSAMNQIGLRQVVLRVLDEPQRYVRSDRVSGQWQFELLKREGCKPFSKVLEIGCGCLHLGIPLLGYLEEGNYVGVDPNEWLRNSAMKDETVAELVQDKKAVFLSVDDFDAGPLGRTFDLVFAHSVMSHFAHWQLEVFLRNTSKVLAPGGKIIASMALAEGNVYGNPGRPDKQDSMDEKWVYPGSSFFTLRTVEQVAAKIATPGAPFGLAVTNVQEYTAFVTATQPDHCHDWLVFQRI